jgi:DNA recombination protein RmuC
MEFGWAAGGLFLGMLIGSLVYLLKSRTLSERNVVLESQMLELTKRIEASDSSNREFALKCDSLGVSQAEFQGKVSVLESQLQSLQSEKEENQQLLENLRKSVTDFAAEKARLESSTDELNKKILALEESSRIQLKENENLLSERNSLSLQMAKTSAEKNSLEEKYTQLKMEFDEQIARHKVEKKELIDDNGKLMTAKVELTATVSRLEEEKRNFTKQFSDFNDTLKNLRETSRTEFELTAKTLLEGNTRSFSESSQARLSELLNPLKEKLNDFSQKVEEKYNNQTINLNTLKNEINRLVELNQQVTSETNALTQALKGDSKFQGDWGELILDKILETAGLQEGEAFTFTREVQQKNIEGTKFRPDVIVNLPEKKHIIIDSKVSLTAYANFIDSTSEKEKEAHLKALVSSVREHFKKLGEKNYESLIGVSSPEFVLMFIPVEAAYLTALHHDIKIVQDAWDRRVAIVTGTTLLTTLKTVASIWKVEKLNRNSDEIARSAASLYDKFVGFVEDFQKIETQIGALQRAYDEAYKKLKHGHGTVIKKMEDFKTLGAQPKKSIPPNLLE